MSTETATPPVEESFATYAARENVREQREKRGDVEVAEIVKTPTLQDADPEKVRAASDSQPSAESQEREANGRYKSTKPNADTPEATAAAEATPPKPEETGDPRKSHQARINVAIAKQREAERKAAALEAEIARLKQPQTAAPQTPEASPQKKAAIVERIANLQKDPEYPKWEDFQDAGFADPYTAYNAAQAAFVAEKLELERAETRQQAEREQAHRSRLDSVHAEGAQKYQDWDALWDTPAASDLMLPAPVLEEIFVNSDSSADVLHYLLTHPDDLMALQGVADPIAAARAIARLPIGVTSAPSGPESTPRPQTKAKPLIKPVSSAPVAAEALDPDDLPFGAKYIAIKNAQERKEQAARRGA